MTALSNKYGHIRRLLYLFRNFLLSIPAEYKYPTVEALLQDMDILLLNCREFNGDNHNLSKDAKKLYENLETSLMHYKRTLGADKDVISAVEEAIKQK
jgi:Bromodomain